MLTIRRILFPTDFSDNAARAFPRAVSLAARHDAELHVVHVTEPSTAPNEQSGRSLPVSSDVLNEWLGRPSGGAGPDLDDLPVIQKQIAAGVPSEQLLAYVEDRDVDLVVMGTHGRRGVQRMLLGSVTEEVVRKAPCPVLTVNPEAEIQPAPTLRHILVPVDFSDAAKAAVRHAQQLALLYGAKLHLLHVVEEVVYPSAYGVEPPVLPIEDVVTRVETSMGAMVRDELGDERVRVTATVGYAPMTILDYAEDTGADLIVIATHGRSGLDRVLLGSVAERVLRRSPIPVFVVKPEEKSLEPSPAAAASADHA
jgi:nucleotide-binding universal stress UspA family protein